MSGLFVYIQSIQYAPKFCKHICSIRKAIRTRSIQILNAGLISIGLIITGNVIFPCRVALVISLSNNIGR